MLDQMTHLFRLQAVIDAGSMRKAAETLSITQPALSRSIAQLEARFGKPLLRRHARGVEPTDFGQRVLSSIERLARHWEIAEAALDNPGSGRLVLRAGPLWRAVVLPELLTQLQRRFPELMVELQDITFQSTIDDLLEGRYDMLFGGIENLDASNARIARRVFTTVNDRVVARENHPILAGLADGEVLPLSRLLDYPWMVYTASPTYEFETLPAAVKRLGKAPTIAIKCESLIAAIRMLQAGDFLCILPDAALSTSSAPRIVPLPVSIGRRKVATGALYREENADWAPLACLLNLCEERFAGSSD